MPSSEPLSPRAALIAAFRAAVDFERRFGNRVDPEILAEHERRWGVVMDLLTEWIRHGKRK